MTTVRRPNARGRTALLLVAALVLVLTGVSPRFTASARAASVPSLGAHYDATGSSIAFSVYSSRATRVDVYIYKAASGARRPSATR